MALRILAPSGRASWGPIPTPLRSISPASLRLRSSGRSGGWFLSEGSYQHLTGMLPGPRYGQKRPVHPPNSVVAVGDEYVLPEPQPTPEPILAVLQRQLKQFSGLWDSFLPMCSLFFFMAFINTILDGLKDTLVITAVGGGAQVIPYLTVYAVFPVSFLFVWAYSYASQRFDRYKLFNWIIILFGVFNLAFALFLYPNHQTLHLHEFAGKMAEILPSGFAGLIGMVRNWTFTLFYCMSELWGDVGLSLLFWSFANEITKMENAPLLYPLFGIGANLAQTLAGIVLRIFSALADATDASFATSLVKLMWIVMVCKIVVVGLHAWIAHRSEVQKKTEDEDKNRMSRGASFAQPVGRGMGASGSKLRNGRTEVVTFTSGTTGGQDAPSEAAQCSENGNVSDGSERLITVPPVTAGGSGGRVGKTQHTQPSTSSSSNTEADAAVGRIGKNDWSLSELKREKKTRRGFREVVKTLSQSPQIRALAIMMFAQSLAVCLMEFTWKSYLRLVYPTPAAFTGFMGDVATATGVVTGTLMVLSPLLFDRLGWSGVAGVTPKLLAYGGILFFVCCLGYQGMSIMGRAAAAQTCLPMVAFVGAMLFVAARGAKFSLFKPAEEMVYICLDDESRTRGKAAIDVVGAQMGKSAGSVVQQVLLLISGGAIFGITPMIFGVYMLMIYGWERAVTDLKTFLGQKGPSPWASATTDAGVGDGAAGLSNGRETDPNDSTTSVETCIGG